MAAAKLTLLVGECQHYTPAWVLWGPVNRLCYSAHQDMVHPRNKSQEPRNLPNQLENRPLLQTKSSLLYSITQYTYYDPSNIENQKHKPLQTRNSDTILRNHADCFVVYDLDCTIHDSKTQNC